MIEEVKRLIRSSTGEPGERGLGGRFYSANELRMIYQTKPVSLRHSLRLLNANSNVKQKH